MKFYGKIHFKSIFKLYLSYRYRFNEDQLGFLVTDFKTDLIKLSWNKYNRPVSFVTTSITTDSVSFDTLKDLTKILSFALVRKLMHCSNFSNLSNLALTITSLSAKAFQAEESILKHTDCEFH